MQKNHSKHDNSLKEMSMPLATVPPPDYRIPVLDNPPNAGGYHDIPFDISDPRAQEPLVKLEDYGIRCHSYGLRSIAGEGEDKTIISGMAQNLWARKTIAEKIVRINGFLSEYGATLLVLDAYRAIAAQRSIWQYYENLARKIMPNASAKERENYALGFVSDPRSFDPGNATTWPVHACGGAVDVAVQDLASGQTLDMGATFDEMSDRVISDFCERQRTAGMIPETHPALVNRRLLHAAMAQEGFVNYPLEYWHFDYGDQMHVLHAQRLGLKDAPKAAWYGYTECPEPV